MSNFGIRKWGAVAALTLAVTAVGLDMTVLNLALPVLATALHASTEDLQWFIDSYTLVLAAAMLPCGVLGDRFGRKRILLVSLLLFGTGSFLCAYASSSGVLIGARIVLGIGAAALMPLSLSVLPVIFTEQERPKAVAVLMIGTMLAFPIGPILGGWMLMKFWWGSVFLINIPVVILAMVAVGALLPESYGTSRLQLDFPGIAMSSAGLVGITYGVIEAGMNGIADAKVLILFAMGIVLLISFVFWERRTLYPLLDLSLFRSSRFTWGTILTTVVSFAMFGVLFAVPQFFQDVNGLDTLETGVRLLPLVGGMLLSAPVANLLAAKMGTNSGVALGFAILAGGLVTGALSKASSSSEFAVVWLTIVGIGLGVAMPTAIDAALGELTPESSGVGSAFIQAIRQVGASIGVAVLGALLNAGYRSKLDIQTLPAQVADIVRKNVSVGVAVAHKLDSASLLATVRSSFVYGMDSMLWVGGALAAIGAVLALTFLPKHVAGRKRALIPAETGDRPNV